MSIKFRKATETISPYIPGKPIDEVKRELNLTRVIKLASNENPLGCSPYARKAIEDALENPALYPDGNCTSLKEALSQKLGVNPSQLMFGAGSDEIIRMIAQIFINPGDESIVSFPSFQSYDIAVQTMDGVLFRVALDKDYRFDLDSMAAGITDKTKVIWLCNPNNPTGSSFSRKEQDNFLGKVPRHIIVVLDEAYYEYVTREDYPESINLLPSHPNIIILRTFSKIYGLASLRAGYAIAGEEITGYLNRVRGAFNVNTFAQVAAAASLKDDDFRNKSREMNIKGKEYLYGEFTGMGLRYLPTDGNFIMVDVGMDSKQTFKKLLEKGIIIRPGDIFKMDTWLRVTVGNQEENEEFIKALRELR